MTKVQICRISISELVKTEGINNVCALQVTYHLVYSWFHNCL